jgi:hypothetical protein
MIFGLSIVAALSASFGVVLPAVDDTSPSAIFEGRIMPIFRSPDPSSCVQCHLSSVDLKHYILPSHEKTFLSLRDRGLIDLQNPRQSKILQLIAMGDRDADPAARMIHESMRQAEYHAFADWIEASCRDTRLRELPPLDPAETAGPQRPVEIIRHARKSRVVDSFVRNVWSQRMRCFPCHTPNEIGPNQTDALAKFEDWESQFGSRMRIFRETPEATVQYLVEQSQNVRDGQLPLVNLNDPSSSLLILKPTARLPARNDGEFLPPSYAEPVSHMGGLKIHVDDQSYKSLMAWLRDYANVVGERYTDVADLPADNWQATQRVLRLKDVPESWPVGTPVQMFVYLRDGNAPSNDQPVAFTQGTVTPRRIVNGALFILMPDRPAETYGSQDETLAEHAEDHDPLPPGNYRIRVFVDSRGALRADPTLLLGPADCVGQVELGEAKWLVGFPKAEFISAGNLKPDQAASGN